MAELDDRVAALSAEKRELLLQRLSQKRGAKSNTEIHALPRDSNRFPLSYAQQRLWFLDQLDPGNCSYNNHAMLRIRGELDVEAMGRSIEEIIRRHEVLRTTFGMEAEQPIQIIGPGSRFELPIVDLQSLTRAEAEAEVVRVAEQEVRRPFELTKGPFLRVKLLKLADPEQHVLLLVMHHIVSDGFFLKVFVGELAELYGAFSNGQASPLDELPIQYADYSVWQREWLQGECLEDHLSYWTRQLDALPLLQLATDYPRPAQITYRGARESLMLPKNLMAALHALSQRNGVTLFMTMLAAFQVLLSRYTQQDDIVVGSPIANRNRGEIEGLIGFFVNSLTLRSDLSGNPSFRELLGRVREVALGAYSHQDMPFEKLVEELRPERDQSRSPLFQVMFAMQNLPLEDLELSGLNLSMESLDVETTRFDLEMHLWDAPNGLNASLVYNTDLFESSTVARMLEHYRVLLEGVVSDPGKPISERPIMTETERAQLVEWNDTRTEYPRNAGIHELFEAQVERDSTSIAVVCPDRFMTYGELNAHSNQLARHLQSVGVGSESRVGVCMERSSELMISLLGVLKAGAAYVPLDPDHPDERRAFMLADSGANVLLTQERLEADLPAAFEGTVVRIDADWPAIASESDTTLATHVHAHSLAHVIYTSGSTGRPKGVCISHRAVARLVMNSDYIDVDAGDRFAQTSNFSFDAATFEIWGALLNGARLVILRKEVLLAPRDLAAAIADHRISVLFLTTAVFNQAAREIPDAFASLEYLLFGGEAVDPRWVRAVLSNAAPTHLLHVYGPTETTTYATSQLITSVPEGATTLPIGRPIDNTQTYVLDPLGQLVPIGVPGELWIGGDGVARGYLNRPGQTAEKFLPNPFSPPGAEPGDRLYRTGDRVRTLADGRIEFLGRVDDQIKLRGFRIEPGEIEAALVKHPDVADAVVILREDEPGNRRLVGYVVASTAAFEDEISGGAEPATQSAFDTGTLRMYLQEQLPSYMVPAALVPLEVLPLNANGKIERKALPRPDGSHRGEGEDFVAPTTPLEITLAKIWCELLGLEKVGIHDNFFDLGGHSLMATQVASRLRDTIQVELPIRTLLTASTVERLANALLEDPEQRERILTTSELFLQIEALSDRHVEAMLAGDETSSP